ncbi:preprotein translocase subunit YajC [Actinoplanes sp. L3-i22]|uniref:preprotein translocase subunit YajC n=1 Tax=Actinoplanes sp. L3-i22 TaxID=2836373 RepID=UPI0021085338|nr:preprotein translocase subunit YajC [Actinoplanes sp. L3-i22]
MAQSAGGGGSLSLFLPFILILGVFYFLVMRPQQKRRREAMELQNKLGAGDTIVTIGGLHGTVVSVEDDVVLLEIAPDVQVRFARPAIAKVVTRADEPVAGSAEDADDLEAAEDETVTSTDTLTEEPPNPVVDVRKKD